MKVREVSAGTALSPTRLPGLDYALNPYRGCAIGCVYCYAPSVLREARPWGRFVDVKRNLPAVLAKELRRAEPGVVGIGTVTDGYQPIEPRYRVTRYCLEQLARRQFPVSIQTKSSLVLQDLPWLARLDDVEVGVTLTTIDDRRRRIFEPFASPTPRRIETLRRLNEASIPTWAFVGPILPGFDRAGVQVLLEAIRDSGTRDVQFDRMRFRPGVWERTSPAAESAGIHREFDALRQDRQVSRTVEEQLIEIGAELGLRVSAAFPGDVWGPEAVPADLVPGSRPPR